LLTDGLILNITKASFVTNTSKKRQQQNVTSSSSQNNYTLCINARNDINNDYNTFPILDFAYSDFDNWIPLKINVTFDGQKYWFKIFLNFFFYSIYNLNFFSGVIPTLSTTIFAISLQRDWETINR
jgi:hypothetical protein